MIATIPSPYQHLVGTSTTLPHPLGPVDPLELDDIFLILRIEFRFSNQNLGIKISILGSLSWDFEFWGLIGIELLFHGHIDQGQSLGSIYYVVISFMRK